MRSGQTSTRFHVQIELYRHTMSRVEYTCHSHQSTVRQTETGTFKSPFIRISSPKVPTAKQPTDLRIIGLTGRKLMWKNVPFHVAIFTFHRCVWCRRNLHCHRYVVHFILAGAQARTDHQTHTQRKCPLCWTSMGLNNLERSRSAIEAKDIRESRAWCRSTGMRARANANLIFSISNCRRSKIKSGSLRGLFTPQTILKRLVSQDYKVGRPTSLWTMTITKHRESILSI